MGKLFSGLLTLGLAATTGLGAATATAQSTIPQVFALTGTPANYTAQYFNSSLGTLNSITLSYSYSDNGNYTVKSNDTVSAIGRSSYLAAIVARDLSNPIPIGINSLAQSSFSRQDGPSTYTAGQSMTFPLASGLLSGTVTDTDSFDLTSLSRANASSFTLQLYVSEGIADSGFSNLPTKFSTTAIFGSLSLVYNYSATVAGAAPEPAMWAMMILGFGLAGTALRRRRMTARVSFAA